MAIPWIILLPLIRLFAPQIYEIVREILDLIGLIPDWGLRSHYRRRAHVQAMDAYRNRNRVQQVRGNLQALRAEVLTRVPDSAKR